MGEAGKEDHREAVNQHNEIGISMKKGEVTMQTWTIEEMKELSVLDILDLPIPAEDRIWASLQSGDHVPVAVEAIVRRAVESHAVGCGIPEVEKWARRWLSGEDRTTEAAWAAQEVSWASARAAENAARAAAQQTWAPTWAARAAARAAWAATDATWATAEEAAERDRQIKDIRAAVMGAQSGEDNDPAHLQGRSEAE
jgi:hypothetical protein